MAAAVALCPPVALDRTYLILVSETGALSVGDVVQRPGCYWLLEGEGDRRAEQFEGPALDGGGAGELVDALSGERPVALVKHSTDYMSGPVSTR
jgi:hypothetical protein